MPNLLALETSSQLLSVAIQKGDGPIIEETLEGFFTHAENLLPIIDRVLEKSQLKIQKIDTFLIGRGPGSFTGLRVGFGTLKGFLAAQKRNCYGGLSLDMIPENIDLPEKSWLAVCLDARREKIYARLYQRRKEHWMPKGKAKVLGLNEVIDMLPEGANIAGDALIRYQNDFERATGPKHYHFLSKAYWYPRAATLIDWYKKNKGMGTSTLKELIKPADFLPLYFRLSEAEENKVHARSR